MGFRNPVTTLAGGSVSVAGAVSALNGLQLLYSGRADQTPAGGIDLSAYASVVVVPDPGSPGGTFNALTAQFTTGRVGDPWVAGESAYWDSTTKRALWVFDVRGRYLTLVWSAGNGTAPYVVSVYGSPVKLEPLYIDQVDTGPFTGYTAVTVAATTVAGYSAAAPISCRAGQARVLMRGVGPVAGTQAFIQPRRLSVDLANGLWVSQQGTASDWMDQLFLPNEPLEVAYYSNAAHAAFKTNLTFGGR